jgi:hypothetical protein
MKNNLKFLLLIVFTIGFSNAQSQDITRFINKRKEKAEDTAIKRTGREADKAVSKEVNKALDKIFGKEEEEAKADDSAIEVKSTSSTSSSGHSSGSTIGMNMSLKTIIALQACGLQMSKVITIRPL